MCSFIHDLRLKAVGSLTPRPSWRHTPTWKKKKFKFKLFTKSSWYVVMDGKEGKWEVHQSSASLMDDMPCDENFFNVFVQQSPEEKNNIVDHFS